jgi:aldose 1-epimerase
VNEEAGFFGRRWTGERNEKTGFRRDAVMTKEPFGHLPDGSAVEIFTLTNDGGLKARLMTYGAILVSLEVPGRDGRPGDVVLGYDTFDGYVKNNPYFGAIVGRYGNRIAKGLFTLDGAAYKLAVNNGENHLHGGVRGFDKVVWAAEPVKETGAVGVKFTYLSKDGEEGYPGNLACAVTYRLTNVKGRAFGSPLARGLYPRASTAEVDPRAKPGAPSADNELTISYEATTDKSTPVNLTHHSYWNLAGQGNGDILRHELGLNADRYTPVDKGLIPTGELVPVKGTPMDFTTPTAIGRRIAQVEGGYDHNYVLNRTGEELSPAARLYDPQSGRTMKISTTEPGIQLYSGNFLDGTITGKSGKIYQRHSGLCLETQHFPDSPNRPNFPSTILKPGRVYKSLTVHKFSTR